MAKQHGHGGMIRIGAALVGHLQSWNLDEQAQVTEGTSMGEAWADNAATVKRWSGSAEVYFDPADAGQNACQVGNVIQLQLYPGGDAPGAEYAQGQAVITGIPVSGTKDGWVAKTVNFAGKGPLIRAAVT